MTKTLIISELQIKILKFLAEHDKPSDVPNIHFLSVYVLERHRITVWQSLHSLQVRGLISSRRFRPKVYNSPLIYKITHKGRRVLKYLKKLEVLING